MASKMISHLSLLLTASLWLSASAQAQYNTKTQQQLARDLVQVPSTSGLIRGFRSANNSVYKFLSVPYAKAPVGELRFKRPVDLAEGISSGIVDATRYAATCPQHRHLARFVSPLLNLDQQHVIAEDCLRLSIFVPATVDSRRASSNVSLLEPSKRVPVIVWIPGEGFDFADERQFDGSLLASQSESIVVSVQYRVGILGFLNMPAMNVSGNMGLHDQLSALRWVQRNIDSFGGDHNRVTVMGRFSGSMSISALLTAPQQNLVESLFKRAVLLSGLAVNDWIIDQRPDFERVESVLQLALRRGYCSQAQIDGQACLHNLPTSQLLEISGYGWKLALDDELIGREDPIEAVKTRGLAPSVEGVLLGETEAEGTLCLYRHMLDQQSEWARLIEEDRLTSSDVFEMIGDDSSTYFKYNVSQTNPIQMALEALSAGQESERSKYLDACSAYMIKSHNNRFKRHLQTRNKMSINSVLERPVDVFHYSLKYKPSFSLAPDYIQTAAHGDDVLLIFGLSQNQALVNQADQLMSQKMISYIKNFAHGNQPLTRTTRPTPTPFESRLSLAEPSTHSIVLSDNELAGAPSDRLALIQIHATSTSTTNMFGADVSFVSGLVLSSCLLIFALMSLCIVLSVIVIRTNSNSA